MELYTGQNRHIDDIEKFTNEINKLESHHISFS